MTKLTANEVKYLAFEGGGGKGNAFLGALEALSDPRLNVGGQQKGILQFTEDMRPTNLKGFAGASAGAITALLVSCGYDPEEIKYIMDSQNFFDFFDTPELGRIPTIGGCKLVPSEPPSPFLLASENTVTVLLDYMIDPASLDTNSPQGPIRLVNAIRYILQQGQYIIQNIGTEEGRRNISREFIYAHGVGYGILLLGVFMLFFGSMLPENPRNKIKRNKRIVVQSIHRDLGVFPGCVVREFFNKWITIARFRVRNSGTYGPARTFREGGKGGVLNELQTLYNNRHPGMMALRNCTFSDHEREFGVRLAVTGTNLETYQSHVFSSQTTPNFLVADAIRISMSLPLVYKPFILKSPADLERIKRPSERSHNHYLSGVWVDGGLFNNIPLHVFDNEPGRNPKTLGLRLEVEVRNNIDSLLKFLDSWPKKMAMGAGEAHVSYTLNNVDQTIVLDTSPLDLFSFQPSPTDLRNVTDRAKRDTLYYFGIRRSADPRLPRPIRRR